MKNFLSFAGAVCLLAGTALYGQTIVSRLPDPAPFRINPGVSFAASSPKADASRNRASSMPPAEGIISDIQQAIDLIRANHAAGRRMANDELTKASITGMLAELDPHSSYFDAKEFSELLGEQDSEYSGTGSTISNYVRSGSMGTYIIAAQRDTAAAKAHLQYGDKIVAVDGVSVSGLVSELVRDKVRGPRGTNVRLTIERAATGKIETLVLRRDRVFQPTLPNFFVVRDGVGYVDLSQGFSHTTSAELDAAMTELHRRGMTSLILDLRGNSGGILDQAIKVAEKFLPGGSTIISQRGRDSFDNREWRSGNAAPEKLPIVILVNGETASASEVVSGALQDNDRALILGQTTFGKGLVQNVLELPMGSGLTLTTGRYYTPSGRSIQRTYAGTGMYDYFNHRLSEEAAGPTRSEARTLTNRPVFGGNGITPDEAIEPEAYRAHRAALLDPIFFFVRDLVNEKLSRVGSLTSSKDQIRQSIIFGARLVEAELVAKFREYLAARPEWKITTATVDQNSGFIADRLNSELALAAFGPEAAKQVRIGADREVARAIDLLPRAARLAETAQRFRISSDNKKTRRVAYPTGQR